VPLDSRLPRRSRWGTTGVGDALPEGLSGEVLRPGDGGYEEARRVHNGLVDKRPS